jgi:transposase
VLRCNACGKEQVPPRSIPRHTNEARSSVVVQRAQGIPLHRLSTLQSLFGVPIAPSTLWKMGKELWELVGKSVFEALCQVAQGGEIYGGDDTKARILEVQKRIKAGEDIRKGCYTSSICTRVDGHEIVLYFTGNQYLAENFLGLFAEKRDGAVVALMIDASSNSEPKLSWVEVGYCIAHGRRKFVELLEFYPQECEFFLKKIAQIYQNDAHTKEEKMNAEERLAYHRQNSRPILREMYREMIRLFREKKVEPNSRLGKVFRYWLKRRYGFGAFTRILGMPLDNNGVERTLRPIAMGRKTSLFFMTLISAGIWSGLFSLVYTCQKNGVNAFEYLNWLQENWQAASQEPERFLPWHFLQDTEKIAA